MPVHVLHFGRARWSCPLPSCEERQPRSSPTEQAASAYLNTHLSSAHGGLAGVAAEAVAAYRRSPTDGDTLEAVRDLEALLLDRYPQRAEAAALAR